MCTEIARVLSKIPLNVWEEVVRKAPAWECLGGLAKEYGVGPFSTMMVVVGLNDFQLKGKAEVAYWPKLKECLAKQDPPSSPRELEKALKRFYQKERLHGLKLRRLHRFLANDLAKELWHATPEELSGHFQQIWHKLAKTMGQSKSAKTIVFAMKCLGISLMIVGKRDFSFDPIPIPVDSRVRRWMERWGVEATTDGEVRAFWNQVLEMLRRKLPLNMIHLDSLVWQIGTKRPEEMVEYFQRLGLERVGRGMVEKLVGADGGRGT